MSRSAKLAPEANRILFVKNLSQIRQGIATNSKGTAFVVYEDVSDAKQACDKLNGFNFQNRYLVGWFSFYHAFIHVYIRLIVLAAVLYHQPEKMIRSKTDLAARQENLERLKMQHGID
ncbi:pre-mRNA branch site protein p14 [Microsporum canis CBS 113480]|uniref:Pre-mRNA branch site protein p14 n=1 Tax=Arthroderma otae (strain ATCC MYA-4605 / CBS 113480) TaxID=554155 RepID=C5FNY8_ARTOC|nr:pre-mRNA branch site protein p14 [Microsporum canis CBS 113480]EEQ31841.1 pre-mRNA branch site protein p14 [Microsporum canis CBS 113480]